MSRRTVSSAARKEALRPLDEDDGVGKETGLPLIQCDKCGLERVIELRSWTDANPGRVFFKCPRNEQGVVGRCKFYEWQRSYLQKLVDESVVVIHRRGGIIQEDEAQSVLNEREGGQRSNVEAQMDALVAAVKTMTVVLVIVAVIGVVFLFK